MSSSPHRALSALAAALLLGACQPATHGSVPATPAAAPPARTAAESVPACPANATVMDGWDDRAPPRRIYGNTWYVGTCG